MKNLTREQELLRKLYECQDIMEDVLDNGKEDDHYQLIQILINRLEKHLQDRIDLK